MSKAESRSRRLRRIAACVSAWALLAPVPGVADEAEPGASLEIEIPSRPGPARPEMPLLWSWQDAQLQLRLESAMAELGLTPALVGGRMSVALVDISDREHPRVSAINGDKMFYAASLPKIAVMLALFEKVEAGELTIDDETHEQLYRMIRISSNPDSTALMQKVGKAYIAQVLRSPRYRLYDPELGGGLWAGKDYASGGLWRRDPINNLSHGATTMQVARFYYLLEREKLVSPRASREMKQVLMRKGSGQKFMKGFRKVRPHAKIFRKGGTWGNFHADGALVERTDGATYIAVALTESSRGREWLEAIAITMDRLIGGVTRHGAQRD